MNQETLTYCKNRLRRRSKKAIKSLIYTKYATISIIQTAYFYTKEIKQQARVFRANFNRINKYDYERNKV